MLERKHKNTNLLERRKKRQKRERAIAKIEKTKKIKAKIKAIVRIGIQDIIE